MTYLNSITNPKMMWKNKHNEFLVPVWDKMCIFLCLMTVVCGIIFVWAFLYCFIKCVDEQKIDLVLNICGMFASFSSAFFISFIVRLYDKRKQKENEEKALVILQPYLKKICTTIDLFYPQLKSFAKISEDNTIQYPHGTVFYTDPSKKGKNRSFITCDEFFLNPHKILLKDLQNCLNSPTLFQCNAGVSILLTKLQQNGLTFNLLNIYKMKNISSDNSVFASLYNNSIEFGKFYKTLARLAAHEPRGILKELSVEERKQYLAEIEKIKLHIPSTNSGRIYKDGDRIQ